MPAVIRTQGALLEGRAGVGLGWLVGPAEMGGPRYRGARGRLEQRNLRRGEEGEADEVGSLGQGETGERERAGRWGQARREGDADCGA